MQAGRKLEIDGGTDQADVLDSTVTATVQLEGQTIIIQIRANQTNRTVFASVYCFFFSSWRPELCSFQLREWTQQWDRSSEWADCWGCPTTLLSNSTQLPFVFLAGEAKHWELQEPWSNLGGTTQVDPVRPWGMGKWGSRCASHVHKEVRRSNSEGNCVECSPNCWSTWRCMS